MTKKRLGVTIVILSLLGICMSACVSRRQNDKESNIPIPSTETIMVSSDFVTIALEETMWTTVEISTVGDSESQDVELQTDAFPTTNTSEMREHLTTEFSSAESTSVSELDLPEIEVTVMAGKESEEKQTPIDIITTTEESDQTISTEYEDVFLPELP